MKRKQAFYNNFSRFRRPAGLLLLIAAHTMVCPVFSQPNDSGWVPLFNGKDFDGLYIRLGGGGTLQDPAIQSAYYLEDSILKVNPGGGGGHIATQQVYSYYHVRIQYRFTAPSGAVNAGLLYHIHPNDYNDGDQYGSKNSQTPYWNQYVQSVECQMYRDHPQKGDAGSFLGIWNVWITAETDGSTANVWQEGGTPYMAYPTTDLYPRRIENSEDHSLTTEWNWLEAIVLGADSVIHLVNGQVVMKGHNLETSDNLQLSAPDDPDRQPMEEGHIGLQAEGSEVFYRNFEIRELTGCTDSTALNYVWYAVKEMEPSDCIYGTIGCRDSNFLEYNPDADVHTQDSCITPIVRGCKDAGYIEYNPDVNVHVQDSCLTLSVHQIYGVLPGNAILNPTLKTLEVIYAGRHSVIIRDMKGEPVFSEMGEGPYMYSLSRIKQTGVYVIFLKCNNRAYVDYYVNN